MFLYWAMEPWLKTVICRRKLNKKTVHTVRTHFLSFYTWLPCSRLYFIIILRSPQISLPFLLVLIKAHKILSGFVTVSLLCKTRGTISPLQLDIAQESMLLHLLWSSIKNCGLGSNSISSALLHSAQYQGMSFKLKGLTFDVVEYYWIHWQILEVLLDSSTQELPIRGISAFNDNRLTFLF